MQGGRYSPGQRSCTICQLRYARPVRIVAPNQRQHDIWFDLDSFTCAKSASKSRKYGPVLKRQVKKAIKHWREPDQGIWEVRGFDHALLNRQVMCWSPSDPGWPSVQGEKSYANSGGPSPLRSKADILEHRVDSRGVFAALAMRALDASLLLVVNGPILPPDDPRVLAPCWPSPTG